MVQRPLTLIAALLLVMVLPPSARPQESRDTSAAFSAPQPGVLSGHAFIPTTSLKDPFIRTFFRTGLGFGTTPELVAPPVTIQDTTVVLGLRGSLLYAVLDAEYQQAIRTWIAVRVRLQVVGRMANEAPALVAQGVTLATGFELGWLFRLVESERLALSGSLGLRNSALTDVYLQRFIDGILEEGTVTRANQLVQTTPLLRFGGGVHGAYAISRVTGLTFSGELDYGEQAERGGADQWYYRLGAAADFDLSVDGGTPIGFVIGASALTSPESRAAGGNSSLSFFGRVAYTGTREFGLGLDLSYDLTPVRGMPERQGFISALVDIRLYF